MIFACYKIREDIHSLYIESPENSFIRNLKWVMDFCQKVSLSGEKCDQFDKCQNISRSFGGTAALGNCREIKIFLSF